MTADSVGPANDIDADAPEQHALGFGDEAVAGADDDVGRVAAEVPVSASAAIACTPPSARTVSAPHSCIA